MIQTTTYVKITRIHLTAGGNSKVYFKDTIFFKVDFSRFSRFSQKNTRQPVVDQRKSCSPTCHEFADFFSPENIAVWSRNQQKLSTTRLARMRTFAYSRLFAGSSTRFDRTTTSLGGNWSWQSPLSICNWKLLIWVCFWYVNRQFSMYVPFLEICKMRFDDF